MPRKRKEQPDGFNKAFPSALRALMEKNRRTQQELADYLGKTRQAIAYYCDGSSSPDWETLTAIARFFAVSSDYLLGLSKVQNPSTEVRAICDYTGLSEAAIWYLKILDAMSGEDSKKSGYARIKLLSDLLELKQFDLFLALCVKYIGFMSALTELKYSESAEYDACKDMLQKHGFVIAMPDEQAQSLFSERITNIMRSLLDDIAENRISGMEE